MGYNIIDFINTKTLNKFSFLKLVDIVYDGKKYVMNFIFPQNIPEISEEDQKIILGYAKQYLNLKSEVEAKFRKSYLEENIILKFVKKYLDENHPIVAQNIDKNAIKISINDIVDVKISATKTIKDIIENKNMLQSLMQEFDKFFCGKIKVEIVEVPDETREDFLENRLAVLERKNILNTISGGKQRYDVKVTAKLIGSEITLMPQYIKDFKKPALSVTISGKIRFLTVKTYKLKKPPKNPNAPTEKQYFSFNIEDKTGKMQAVLFPTKASYHKAMLLKDGDLVVVKGDIKEYGERLSISVKDLSLCEAVKQEPKQNAIEAMFNSDEINYSYIFPKKYISALQQNMFEKVDAINPNTLGREYVVFDLETTGLEAQEEDIIEIGAVRIKDGVMQETFSSFVKPSKLIPEKITQITGINDSMVADAPAIDQVLPDFYRFCKDSVLVAYNIPFDYSFIRKVSKQLSYEFNNEQIDVLMLAREKIKGLKHYNLSSVCTYLGVSLIGAHRAIEDAIATAKVFLKLY